jgi:hypothetical protein
VCSEYGILKKRRAYSKNSIPLTFTGLASDPRLSETNNKKAIQDGELHG